MYSLRLCFLFLQRTDPILIFLHNFTVHCTSSIKQLRFFSPQIFCLVVYFIKLFLVGDFVLFVRLCCFYSRSLPFSLFLSMFVELFKGK